MTTATAGQAPRSAAIGEPRFYFWMMAIMAVVAVVGFLPTFWIPLADGLPERIAVIAAHATIFYGWMVFVVYQTWLATNGKFARHRRVGLIGVSLATAMVIFGTLAAINSGVRATAAGFPGVAETFMVVPLGALFLFAVFVLAALINARRIEWHKRFMIAATAMTLDAAIARPYLIYGLMGGHPPPFHGNVGLAGLPEPPPPPSILLPPSLVAILFVVAAMIYDWRTRGKVHPAYWWAAGVALGVHLLKIPLSETHLWHGFAHWMISLAT